MIYHCGGAVWTEPIERGGGGEGLDAISLKIADVPCCYSKATGNADLTFGIAGAMSKNKCKNDEAKKWTTRFFIRGVTSNGWESTRFQQALDEIVKMYGF